MKKKNSRRVTIGARKEVLASHIIYLKADENYTEVYLTKGRQEYVATTLGVLEKRLSGFGFIRPNRKVVINPNFITKIVADQVFTRGCGAFKISRRRTINL